MGKMFTNIGRREKSRLRLGAMAKLDLISGEVACMLVDISTTGVRLALSDAPKAGECAVLRIEDIEAFGTIVWRSPDFCGMRFDRPLHEGAVIRLRQTGDMSSENERMAQRNFAQKWAQGG